MPDPPSPSFGREFPAGEILFREGDNGTVMYVIQAGRVKISRAFVSGDRTLAVLGPGEFFGEMAILNGKARTATATVLDPVRALVIDARTFEAMVVGNTEIAVRLIKKLSQRLDNANAFVEMLLERDPRIRVLLGLTRVADEFGQRTDEGLHVPVSTGELAQEIGLPEPEVAEVLARLERVRVLTRAEGDEGGWWINNVSSLREFVDLVGDRFEGA